jgi:HlyD family secretion protein
MQAPTLFVIARDLTAMRVEASIAESDVGRIETGQTAAFTVDAYPGAIFNGTVSQVRLQPVIEQNVVSYVTIIDVPNPDLRLKPGMTANVTVEIARANGVLRVPNAALRVRPSAEVLAALGQPEAAEPKSSGDWPGTPAGSATAAPREPDGGAHGQVWVMTDGRLTRVPVRLGVSDGSATAVLGGRLDEGTEVVTGLSGNASTAPPSTTSPLLPSRGRGPGAAGRSPVSRTPGA